MFGGLCKRDSLVNLGHLISFSEKKGNRQGVDQDAPGHHGPEAMRNSTPTGILYYSITISFRQKRFLKNKIVAQDN